MRHLKPIRRAAAALAASLALAAAGVAAPAPASAFSMTSNGVRLNAVEARLASLINHARTSRGLPALTVAPGTTDLARAWSMNQASRRLMYHNPNLVSGVQRHGSSDWRAVAENVGYGWDADSLFQAYMNSPGHRANILDSGMRYLGIGWVERPDGSGYNTQVFVDRYSSAYGRTRSPAVGGLKDTRTPTSPMAVATFENGWDARTLVARSGSGLSVAGPYFPSPATGDQSVRFAVRELVAGTGGAGELKVRDALDLRHASGLRVKVSAVSASGRAVTLKVALKRELGSSVVLGTVTVPSGGSFVTKTFPLPSGARNFRNAVSISVPRTSLHALSSTLSGRQVSVRVSDIAVMA